MMKNSVEVEIHGQKFNLRTEFPENHVKEIAAYLNKKMGEVDDSLKNRNIHNVAVLAALNIAEENVALKKELKEFKQRVLETSKHVLEALDNPQ